MTDEPEETIAVSLDPEPTPELFMDAGSAWLLDAADLCKEFNAIGFANGDGSVVAYIRGEGEVSLAKLMKEWKPKRGEVRTIKGGKQ